MGSLDLQNKKLHYPYENLIAIKDINKFYKRIRKIIKHRTNHKNYKLYTFQCLNIAINFTCV